MTRKLARRDIAVLLVLCTAGCDRDPLSVETLPNAVLEVRDPDGSPAESAWVGIQGAQSLFFGWTDSTGHAYGTLWDVVDGPAVVSAIKRDTLVAAAHVTIGNGSRFFLLTLARGGALRGRATCLDDSTNRGIDIRIDQTQIRTWPRDSGNYVFAVPAGTWTLKARAGGYTGWQRTMTMPSAGDTVDLPPIVLARVSSSRSAAKATALMSSPSLAPSP